MRIEVKNLSHIYAQGTPFESAAVKDVSFAIESGEMIGLIGHTGSGKSTLIQHLNGLEKPTSGTVTVDGTDINQKGASLKSVRSRVGLVFQYPEYQLFEETVLKDIAFGPKNLGLSEDQAAEKAKAAAMLAGLPEDLWERSPFDLSGGQKRRAAIAGVLAMEPELLILDEPAAGLDPAGRREILTLLKILHEEKGMSLLMVSHSMTDVSRLCSRVMVMNQGRLVMDDAPEKVFARGEELTRMGLGLPEGAELAMKLRRAGFDLPEGLWRMEDVEEAILAALKGGIVR